MDLLMVMWCLAVMVTETEIGILCDEPLYRAILMEWFSLWTL